MLKVTLLVVEEYIFAQVISMSNGLRGRARFVASNGFEIQSSGCPELRYEKLYICGNDTTQDNNIIYYRYEDNDNAMDMANKIALAIKQFTKNEHSVMVFTESDIFDTVNTNGTLKLNMLKWGCMLITKVVDMAEKDRGIKAISYKNIKIKSGNHPQLTPDVLFVRGTYKRYDNDILYERFETTSKLKEYVDNITVAVKMWNNSTENTVQFYDFIPIF